jgi:tricorn protease-like protein
LDLIITHTLRDKLKRYRSMVTKNAAKCPPVISAAMLLLLIAPLTATRAALPRFPQPFGDRIVFVANGGVWSIPKSGGTSVRLTSAPGHVLGPER